MACCGKRSSLTHKFTILQVHVVGATSIEALQNSNLFALTIVKDFFRKYTRINPERLTEFAYNFEHLVIDSRLEIVFEGKPKGFEAPSCKVFTNETPAGTVIFDVETKIIERFIAPGFEYRDLKIDRTDYLPSYEGGSVTQTSYAADHTANNPGPSRVPTEEVRGRKAQHRYSTRLVNSGYEVPKTRERPAYDVPRHIAWEKPTYMNMHIRQ
jgi:hypothetical protein